MERPEYISTYSFLDFTESLSKQGLVQKSKHSSIDRRSCICISVLASFRRTRPPLALTVPRSLVPFEGRSKFTEPAADIKQIKQ